MQTAREITRTSQKLEKLLLMCFIPYPRDRTASTTPGPEGLDLSRGLPGGDGKRAIEPCITESQTHKINLELTCEQKKTFIRVNFTVGFQLRHHVIIS